MIDDLCRGQGRVRNINQYKLDSQTKIGQKHLASQKLDFTQKT